MSRRGAAVDRSQALELIRVLRALGTFRRLKLRQSSSIRLLTSLTLSRKLLSKLALQARLALRKLGLATATALRSGVVTLAEEPLNSSSDCQQPDVAEKQSEIGEIIAKRLRFLERLLEQLLCSNQETNRHIIGYIGGVTLHPRVM